jgi:hypothetical protein
MANRMVIEGRGPVQAIRRSRQLLATTWGEDLIAQVGMGVYALVLLLPVLVAACIGAAVHLWVGLAVGVVGVTKVCSYIAALDAVFRVALYRYATSGALPREYALSGLGTVFRSKKRRWS